MKNLKLLGIIVVVFIVGVFVGISGNSKSSSTTSSQIETTVSETVKDTGKVEVKSHSKKLNDRGLTEIVGEVVNNTAKPVTYVKVIVTFYDQKNAVIGTSFTYAGDTSDTPLVVDATTPFELSSYPNEFDADHYKLDVSWR